MNNVQWLIAYWAGEKAYDSFAPCPYPEDEPELCAAWQEGYESAEANVAYCDNPDRFQVVSVEPVWVRQVCVNKSLFEE